MPTVLIVDDSLTDRLLAGGLLNDLEQVKIEYAVDGKDAVVKIELQAPDVIITDLDMPEMNGLELVSVIRREYPQVPVILITAIGSEQIAIQALRSGAASYVPKNSLYLKLAETVQQVLSVARKSRGRVRLMRRLVEQEIRFVIENDQELISALAHYLQDLATESGVCDQSERVRIGIALHEAFTNAYYHGNLEVSSALREADHRLFYDLSRERSAVPPYSHRKIHVLAKYSPNHFECRIRDEGPGFDRRVLSDPTDPMNLLQASGRGLLLMRNFMDEVKHNKSGNEVTMIKRRKRAGV